MMTVHRRRQMFWAVLVVAALARAITIAMRPSPYPDAFFQYLEPAWWHLNGYGWPSWEWGVGLRSWVVPAYHGAWMALLSWLHVKNTEVVLLVLEAQWALWGLTLVAACWRAGQRLAAGLRHSSAIESPTRGWEGGLFAALLASTFAPFLYFSVHTQTEVPSAILMMWGYVFWLEGRSGVASTASRACWLAGITLSAAACLRIPNGPLVLVPTIDLLFRRRFRGFAELCGGALLVVLAFGTVDRFTWGDYFHSAREFIDYNFVQGRAAEHGISPRDEYVKWHFARLGPAAAALLVIPIVLSFDRTWPLAVPALLFLGALSTQPHKEERFLYAMWPLLMAAWGGGVGRLLASVERGPSRIAGWVIASASLVAIIVAGVRSVGKMDPLDYTGRWGLYAGESWAGRQSDVTGVLIEGRFHLGGGWMMLGKNVPLEVFDPSRLDLPIFNYAVVPERSSLASACEQHGFVVGWQRDGFVVYRRGSYLRR